MIRYVGLGALGAYIGTIFAANWAIETYGLVPVGLGLLAPAGVYFVGLAFTFRDIVQHTLGRYATVGAICVGAGLSAIVSPTFALASAVAFLVSELADFAVYTPLRERGWTRAVVASNAKAIGCDSVDGSKWPKWKRHWLRQGLSLVAQPQQLQTRAA